MSPREFDVVIFGATGFTGTLACEYLDATVRMARENEKVKAEHRAYSVAREFHQYV